MRTKAFLIFIFLCINISFGQDYYPLQIGNRWFYEHLDEFYFKECDIVEIVDTTRINGKLYYCFQSKNAGVDILAYGYARKDSLNQVWGVKETNDGKYTEYIFRKLDVPVGTSWYNYHHGLTYRTTLIDTSITITTSAGFFDHCYYYTDLIEDLFTDLNYYYAPDVGLVRSLTEGLETELKGARVNEVLYGDTTITRIESVCEKLIPETFKLHQNFPNPFNLSTYISYSLDTITPQKIKLTIYEITGRKIRILVDEEQGTGYYKVVWDGTNDNGNEVSSGIYFYELISNGQRKTRKLIITK